MSSRREQSRRKEDNAKEEQILSDSKESIERHRLKFIFNGD